RMVSRLTSDLDSIAELVDQHWRPGRNGRGALLRADRRRARQTARQGPNTPVPTSGSETARTG
ncbi:hypothetical protein, partial [Micromonospora sp. NPDC048843]|uniref:hypothetical protein n=1 Tax=Micromonospora sp. NPDC048843 TaxID=3155389 RepID=UPI0033C80C90